MAKKETVTTQNGENGQLMQGVSDVHNDENAAGDKEAMQESGSSTECGGGEEDGAGTENKENQDPETGTENGENPEEGGEPEEIPKILTAVYPILYLSHQYKVGDRLPANNPEMVAAWIEAGTAAWISEACLSVPKAGSRTAEPGLAGQAVSSEAGNYDNLVGRISRTNSRKR